MSFENLRKQIHSHLASKGYEYHGVEQHGTERTHTWKKGPKHIHVSHDYMNSDDHVSVSVPHKVQYTKHKINSFKLTDIKEALDPSMGSSAYIHDFVHSKNKMFKGKSKKERIKMALGAYYSSKKTVKESNMSEFINLVAEKNAAEFQEKIKARIAERVETAMSDRKKQIASTMFENVNLTNVPAVISRLTK